jgi:4-hydroxy-3-polyprenylbenzoate decarboxylase
MTRKKIIIGITGASGAIYGKILLESLAALKDQVEMCGVIFSRNALPVWNYEIGPFDPATVPFTIYQPDNFFAPAASGSAGYDAMIICPCSMGTLGRIASGVSNDLMTRSADVMLKERRKLILVPREAPYNLIHIRNMETLTLAGAVILPASPSFYSKPATMEELVKTITDRALILAGFELPSYRWGE